jgi:hypothetical protein
MGGNNLRNKSKKAGATGISFHVLKLRYLQASLFQDDPLTAPCVLIPYLNPAN